MAEENEKPESVSSETKAIWQKVWDLLSQLADTQPEKDNPIPKDVLARNQPNLKVQVSDVPLPKDGENYSESELERIAWHWHVGDLFYRRGASYKKLLLAKYSVSNAVILGACEKAGFREKSPSKEERLVEENAAKDARIAELEARLAKEVEEVSVEADAKSEASDGKEESGD